MNLTFGILTAYEDFPRLKAVIESIQALKIPTCEILIAGSYGRSLAQLNTPGISHLLTDGWITKKRNMVAKFAQHENLVLLHDYFLFDPEWYDGYVRFGDKWDVCSNPQFLLNGNRHFTDWVIWDDPVLPRYHSLRHDDWTHTKYMYVSGGYFLVKRDFLRDNPFNEEMPPGSPEDVEWSLRIRDKAEMVCNPLSVVRHNKKHRDCE